MTIGQNEPLDISVFKMATMPRRWMPVANPSSLRSSSLRPSTITLPEILFFLNTETVVSSMPRALSTAAICLGFMSAKTSAVKLTAEAIVVVVFLLIGVVVLLVGEVVVSLRIDVFVVIGLHAVVVGAAIQIQSVA